LRYSHFLSEYTNVSADDFVSLGLSRSWHRFNPSVFANRERIIARQRSSRPFLGRLFLQKRGQRIASNNRNNAARVGQRVDKLESILLQR
jgi:hypothetical protein